MLIIVVGLGSFFDLYEVFLGGVLGAVLTDQWHLSTNEKSFVIASAFMGMFVGAIVLGIAADRFGRRRMFLLNLGLYSLFSLLTAFAPDLGAFLVLRFLCGVALGAELTLVDTYLSEFLPRLGRGRYIACAYTIGFCGVPVAAFLGGRFVADERLLIDGWRWLLIFGALGALIVWILRSRLPESPRWLLAQGRAEEAEAIVAGAESAVAAVRGPLPPVADIPDEPAVRLTLARRGDLPDRDPQQRHQRRLLAVACHVRGAAVRRPQRARPPRCGHRLHRLGGHPPHPLPGRRDPRPA
jgi:putative MFS transporter